MNKEEFINELKKNKYRTNQTTINITRGILYYFKRGK